MARKLRIQFPGARYHVLNRGNYRSWIFETEGAKKSFTKCLCEISETAGWQLHSWCLMENHFHLALETPRGNLVEGMRWLQSTFANRFNRFRGENGHVFQGRYKAILLDQEALSKVCHYVHLNPVRAGLTSVDQLQNYRWSSFTQLWKPKLRWEFQRFDAFLDDAGGLNDNPAGRRAYRDYLSWLEAEPTEQKKLGFEKITRGWINGSKDFRKEILQAHEIAEEQLIESDSAEVREELWERTLRSALDILGKTDADLLKDRKGEAWKVALARLLRQKHLAPNAWISERLSMGKPGTVSQYVNHHKRTGEKEASWEKMKNAKMLD